jgi:phenylacetate-coenzyme A ligase PaaK-like adenylate-forming protein
MRAIWTARMLWAARLEARFPFFPEATIREAQQRRVRAIVAYAHSHVPYYRETMRRLIVTPADFHSAGDLARLPLLERDHLQRDPEYFLSNLWSTAACVQLQSGGTTGAPMTVFRDPPSLLVESAHRERLRSLVARLSGRRVRYREASIKPHDSSVSTAVSAVRRTSLVPPALRVERREFSMLRSPADLIPQLDDYRADVISAYGSYLEALFSHARAHRQRLRPVRVAVYGADSLSATVRAWARAELGIESLSSYNAVETPQIGFDCEHHRGHHLNVDLCPIRLIGPDGRDMRNGDSGELVVSNLINRGTVLLNYRLGDVIARTGENCSCGRTLPLASYPERRGTRWLDLGDGVTIHSQALQLLLRTEMEIWRYQIVQEAPCRFLLRLVPSPDCDREAMTSRLLAGFREQLGGSATVRVEFVSELPTSPGGKVQAIVGL